MDVRLRVWRQTDRDDKGGFVEYEANDIAEEPPLLPTEANRVPSGENDKSRTR